MILTDVHQFGLGFDFCGHLKKYNSEFVSKIREDIAFQVLDNHSNTILLIRKLLDIAYNEVRKKDFGREVFKSL